MLDLKSMIVRMSGRSKEAVRNIVLSLGAKGISMLASLLIVPITIDYINPTQYGIWLSLSQIIAWVNYFDFGMANGFRNKYAEAKALGNMELARQYLATTYFALSCIIIAVLVILLPANHFIDWSALLHIDASYKDELRDVFGIVLFFFSINIVANIFSILLSADQKPGISSLISGVAQLISLGVLFVISKTTDGSLTNLALYYSGIPAIVMLLASLFAFNFTKFKEVRPRIKDIRPALIKDILNLGIKFFVICLCMIAIFQITNIIISRELGPDSVTQYNIVFKYFSILFNIFLLIVTPFWSAFTDAFAKNDIAWMRSTIKKLEQTFFFFTCVGLLMLVLSGPFYKIWIGDSVVVPFMLSAGMLVFVLSQCLSNIYMYMINGIGTVSIQLWIYLVFALISWPMLGWSCRTVGILGSVLLPTLVYIIQAVLLKIQLSKILDGNASGLWLK